jgi:hypothetical protein
LSTPHELVSKLKEKEKEFEDLRKNSEERQGRLRCTMKTSSRAY